VNERQSVTEIVAAPRRSATAPDLVRRWQAQTLGTRIHKAFEALKYGHAPAAAFEKPVEFVLQLEQPPVRELIACGHSEWGFQVQTSARVIEGQIDLWGKVDGRIYVVDYKSGSPQAKEEAFAQLQVYAWALRRFGHKEPIEMVVIYPLAEKYESREFTAALFAGWEREFSSAHSAGQDKLGAPLLDGGHGDAEAHVIDGGKLVGVREEGL
jgi:ATP-dependent exoDNAse (exonuclease V) beta subunit